MVWGCKSSADVGELVFIEGTLNADGYMNICVKI